MASSPSTNSISSLSQNKTQETEGELADDKESEPTLDLDSLLDDSVESRISASYHSNNSDGLNPSRWDRRTTSPRKEKSLVCFKSPPLPPIPSYLQKSCQQHKQNLNEMLLNVLDCLPTSIISEILMQYLHPPIVHACKGCEKSRFIEEFPISTQKRIEKLYTPRETGEYDWMTPEMLKPTHTLSPRAFCSQCYNSGLSYIYRYAHISTLITQLDILLFYFKRIFSRKHTHTHTLSLSLSLSLSVYICMYVRMCSAKAKGVSRSDGSIIHTREIHIHTLKCLIPIHPTHSLSLSFFFSIPLVSSRHSPSLSIQNQHY